MKTWLKGGLIGAGIYIILGFLSLFPAISYRLYLRWINYPSIPLLSSCFNIIPCSGEFCLGGYICLFIGTFLSNLIIGFIIGAILGLIIGKIGRKNEFN